MLNKKNPNNIVIFQVSYNIFENILVHIRMCFRRSKSLSLVITIIYTYAYFQPPPDPCGAPIRTFHRVTKLYDARLGRIIIYTFVGAAVVLYFIGRRTISSKNRNAAKIKGLCGHRKRVCTTYTRIYNQGRRECKVAQCGRQNCFLKLYTFLSVILFFGNI